MPSDAKLKEQSGAKNTSEKTFNTFEEFRSEFYPRSEVGSAHSGQGSEFGVELARSSVEKLNKDFFKP